MRRNAQAGFSLIELLVAMVVTLFIVGSVIGLLTGGQTAFKTQPERTDRQQNIRAGMDIIMRDIGAAGIGMPVFMQVFQTNLNNVGPANAATVASQLTDQIQTIANTEGFENEYACNYPGGHSSHVFMKSTYTKLFQNQPVLVIMADGTWTLRNVTSADSNATNTHSGGCTDAANGDKHADVDFNPGQDPSGLNTAGGLCVDNGWGNAHTSANCAVEYISSGDVIQYRVSDGADGTPNLERQVNAGGWQVLARGVDDMQVQYVKSDLAGTVSDNAPVVALDDYKTLTAQVRVTLSARGSAGRFQGATTAAQGPMAIRASLTSQVSPRMALWSLSEASPDPGAIPWK